MKNYRIISIILLLIITVNSRNVISRKSGNIWKNLTQTHTFVNNVVTSELDASRNRWFYRGFREIYTSFLGPTGSREKGKRIQKRVHENIPFPCDTSQFRSAVTPTSVHHLMPGDIDIVAALGDSLTSATAANSVGLWEVLIENRGLAWSIGGQDTWRTHLTLPNIIKVFNPNLFGYSLSDSYNVHRSSQFNVAENIAATSDMPYNAVKLFKRMKADARVNMTHHWKLVTLMIGGNDFCFDVCYQTNATDWINTNQEENLIETMLFLRDNMPRTLVNLVPSPLVSLLLSIEKVQEMPFNCHLSHPVECSCFFGPAYSKDRDLFRRLERNFVEIMERVTYRSELHTNDFTVVYQPFWREASVFFNNENGKSDMNLMAIDCLHLSQKGQAVSANGLWNNMLEPVGGKTLGLRKLWKDFKCPTLQNPYFYTNYNSLSLKKDDDESSDKNEPSDNVDPSEDNNPNDNDDFRNNENSSDNEGSSDNDEPSDSYKMSEHIDLNEDEKPNKNEEPSNSEHPRKNDNVSDNDEPSDYNEASEDYQPRENDNPSNNDNLSENDNPIDNLDQTNNVNQRDSNEPTDNADQNDDQSDDEKLYN